MNTRNVTNTAFVSYPATGMQLPNGRQLANSYDARLPPHPGPGRDQQRQRRRLAILRPVAGRGSRARQRSDLHLDEQCATNSAVQPSVTNPSWGNQFSDRLGYDGEGGRSPSVTWPAGSMAPPAHTMTPHPWSALRPNMTWQATSFTNGTYTAKSGAIFMNRSNTALQPVATTL